MRALLEWRRFVVLCSCLVIVLLSVSTPRARATVLRDTRFERLAEIADTIVVGRVGGYEVVPAAAGAPTAWEVHTEVLVDRVLRGQRARTLTVRQLGDRESGAAACAGGEHISDDACLQQGSQVLLFLRVGDGAHMHLALLGYSAFDVVRRDAVLVAIPHARPARAAHRPVGPPRALGESATLAGIEAWVAQLDARGGP